MIKYKDIYRFPGTWEVRGQGVAFPTKVNNLENKQ